MELGLASVDHLLTPPYGRSSPKVPLHLYYGDRHGLVDVPSVVVDISRTRVIMPAQREALLILPQLLRMLQHYVTSMRGL